MSAMRLFPSSRFDLAYNAAHAFALAASRLNGYRPENRYVVFQALSHTLGLDAKGLDAKIWRVLAKCHNGRNLAEYEAHSES
jgi:RNase P/RNase MRP subunit POP5